MGVKHLIKCTTSFMIGFYLAFVLTLSIAGWVIVTEFVSKTSLKTNIVYIDGDVYEVRKKDN
jgi:heme/copper-type cytochrome/quinol oxidase subunit 4